MKPIILDLCGGTGSWSRPYAEAGYDVRLIDLDKSNIDVRLFQFKKRLNIKGVLAAPPCTYFCRMRMCRGKPTNEQLIEGLSVVDACLRIIITCKPKWWALENPQGYLANYLGPPAMKFHPWEFGDAWTKRTWIWGDFAPPMSNGSSIPKNRLAGNKRGNLAIAQTFDDRAQTPKGFARAFFEANP